ncbi:MAG: peptidoglycan-binding domain-containing protein [Polyangiaceae bacterium]
MFHLVNSTDCVHSIAAFYGHSWKTIWNHPQNEELRKIRETPMCLEAGDKVFIPPIEIRQLELDTARSYRFKRKEVPHRLRLTFEDEQELPRSNLEFELEVGGRVHTGKTDGDGRIDVPIPPDTTAAILRFFAVDESTGERYVLERYDLVVGGLDPVGTARGAQARLKSLGLYWGRIDGELGPLSREALALFQQDNRLERTGELDEPTKAALFKAQER